MCTDTLIQLESVSAWYQYRCITSLTLTHTLLSGKTNQVEIERANMENEIYLEIWILHAHTDFLMLLPFPCPLVFFSSILNKLTPEKFDKLCLELLNVGVDSKLVLKGIILLVRGHFYSVLC